MAVHKKCLDGVGLVTIENGKANALDLELLLGLRQVLEEWDPDSEGAMVLTGAGRMFSAGVDLKRLLAEDEGYCREFCIQLDACFRVLLALPVPAVAAINGHAIAGGCILAVACDHRIMAPEQAKIGVTELLVGLPFPPIALELMQQAVSPPVVQELIYRGRLLSPAEALGINLVDQLAEAVLREALDTAKQLAEIPQATFSLTKRQLRDPIMRSLAASGDRFGQEMRAIWDSADSRERIRSYMASVLRKKE